VPGDVVENFGGQFARDAHALCALGVFDGDGHVRNYPIQLARIVSWTYFASDAL
jgi:hypothetical protein